MTVDIDVQRQLSRALGDAITERFRVYERVLSSLPNPPASIHDAHEQGLLSDLDIHEIRYVETEYIAVLKANREWYREQGIEIPRHLAKRQQMVVTAAPAAHED